MDYLVKFSALLLLAIATSTTSTAQTQLTGQIRDADTREPLSYAAIATPTAAVYADIDGYFSLETDSDSITVSYVGYHSRRFAVSDLPTDGELQLLLTASETLPQLTIRAPKYLAPGGAVIAPDLTRLAQLPVLAGEQDFIKSLTTLPGISSPIEGTANLIIRGGSFDQTQVLLDGSEVYNVNHFGGFLSAVPPYGTKAITVYKGGAPARFGGRLSGVVDVRLRAGRQDKWGGEYSIGTATARAGIEGPMGENGSLLVSGRYAYPSLLLDAFQLKDYKYKERGEKTDIELYDLLLKYQHRLSTSQTISASVLFAGDRLLLQEDLGAILVENVAWQNLTAVANHAWTINGRWRLQSRVRLTNYYYQLTQFERRRGFAEGDPDRISDFRNRSRIFDVGAQSVATYQANNRLLVRGGAVTTRHQVSSLANEVFGFAVQANRDIRSDNTGVEQAFFTEAEWEPLPGWQLVGGLRLAGLYTDDAWTGGWQFEPRLRSSWAFRDNLRFNAGYDRQRQFIQQLQIGAAFPNSLFLLSTGNSERTGQAVLPSTAEQVYAGFSGTFGKQWEWYAEAYTRRLANLTRLSLDRYLTYEVPGSVLNEIYTGGTGNAAGIELYAAKTEGRVTGSVGYTLARSRRSFQEINNGREYPYLYDRRHDFSGTVSYQFNSTWSAAAGWFYQTGVAATLPIGFTPITIIYTDYNTGRLPNYHRADLSITRSWNSKKRPKNRKTLGLSIYNVYNRENVFDVELRNRSREEIDPVTGMVTQVTFKEVIPRGLFPILPGLTYAVQW